MIRPYHISDKEALMEILNLNVPKFFAPNEVNDFIDYLEIKKETYLTIEFENKIIGGVGYEIRESDRSGRINWIFLHPEFSGTGQGRKAAEFCLAILRSDPAVEVLIVRTTQHAYKFFEKLGYQLIRVEKDYWAPGFDLYLMEEKIKTNPSP